MIIPKTPLSTDPRMDRLVAILRDLPMQRQEQLIKELKGEGKHHEQDQPYRPNQGAEKGRNVMAKRDKDIGD